jgi:class 3 adenylate cyclase
MRYEAGGTRSDDLSSLVHFRSPRFSDSDRIARRATWITQGSPMGPDAKLEHRLAAIMAMDVVGYSQSMQSDEAGTLAALSAIRKATENQINEHRGRIANTAGDSVVAEFGSAVQAVSSIERNGLATPALSFAVKIRCPDCKT